ncbi:SAM-dependent methyltransferase [Nonomuraea mesophila]|uniref:SAM-dependent methyltransferase n=1 Tax=Nonomuraea mesophila TaxID=2530382 RepID=A0A4R5FVZ2_9ACTN|nr:class I SAM-dependent methyltransferase [Nonomuraea mesophila]TDE58201.1 SAM-dependent methyltransferase [Nonomuraea mesophila]
MAFTTEGSADQPSVPAATQPSWIRPVSEGTEQATPNDYDSFAEAYSAENETSLLNAYYERPAMLNLAGDVAGRRILDAGCGSGPLSAALRDRGAVMTGFDSSAKLLELARRRLGDGADLHLADLTDPLPFPDAAFDDVVASLVLHYLEDWTAPLAELRRVLRPGGRLLVSVNHPFVDFLDAARSGGSYFGIRETREEWTLGGHTALMRFYGRPLHAMADAFTGAGFHITGIDEPSPAPEARELYPDVFADRPSGTFVCFLFFALQAG